jgi:hypothetical protein
MYYDFDFFLLSPLFIMKKNFFDFIIYHKSDVRESFKKIY